MSKPQPSPPRFLVLADQAFPVLVRYIGLGLAVSAALLEWLADTQLSAPLLALAGAMIAGERLTRAVYALTRPPPEEEDA